MVYGNYKKRNINISSYVNIKSLRGLSKNFVEKVDRILFESGGYLIYEESKNEEELYKNT